MLDVQLLRDHPKLRQPWLPSWKLAFALLFLVRAIAAMYVILSDCDEVYNYWEPVHLLASPFALDSTPASAFQTWEYAPQFAIRSWAYVSLHALVPAIVMRFFSGRYAFYALRVVLAAASAAVDASLYKSTALYVNLRTGRYLLVFLVASPGMIAASVALLPSSFVMCTTSLAISYALPRASILNQKRSFGATLAFAIGALAGWPYALLLSLPFIVEELFLHGGDAIPATESMHWLLKRWIRLFLAITAASLLAFPVLGVDSLAYGRWTLPAINSVLYNLLGRARGISPDLYGTESWSYYPLNLILNLGLVTPLALLSMPAVLITAMSSPARFSGDFPGSKTPRKFGAIRAPGSKPSTLLLFRVMPAYLWIALLIVQPHKEERFLYPIYPLLCLNAAITLYIGRAWCEAFYLRLTRSPYRASRSWLLPFSTLMPLAVTILFGISRLTALTNHYHAPMSVLHLLPDENATLCYGKEWHRFPSHFFVPPRVQVQFIQSEFRGILPSHFLNARIDDVSNVVWPWAGATRHASDRINEFNREEPDRYVDVSRCDYLVDVDFPARPETSREPRFVTSKEWEKVSCTPFLDAEGSRNTSRHRPIAQRLVATLARIFWLPASIQQHLPVWNSSLHYGDYCLLKRAEVGAAT